MAFARRCDNCGSSYIGKNSRSRFCSSTCRAKFHQRGGDGAQSRHAEAGSWLSEATRKALAAVEREDSPLGQSALGLARRIESGADTGGGLASLNREWRAVMAEALEGVAGAGDGLDELKERRASKYDRASAG